MCKRLEGLKCLAKVAGQCSDNTRMKWVARKQGEGSKAGFRGSLWSRCEADRAFRVTCRINRIMLASC